MRIAQLLEFQKEDFRQMSQQAGNIQHPWNRNPVTRDGNQLAQVDQNVTQTAPQDNAPVELTATPQDTGGTPPQQQQQNAPMDPTLAQNLPGQPAPKKSIAQHIGGLAKGVGAVAGGVAGIGRAVKKGYAAGANAVGGPGHAQPGAAGGSNGGQSGGGGIGTPGGNAQDEIADLRSTIQQMDQRLRRIGAE